MVAGACLAETRNDVDCADIVDGTIAGLNAGKRAHLDGRREWHASAIDDATSARHH